MMVLETDRLVLRWLRADDAAFIRGLLNEPAFLEFIGDRGVRSLEDARDYIREGPSKSYAANGFGLNLVLRKSDGAALGICGLLKREELEDVDLGFALCEANWGRGYAFEAARAVLAHARNHLGLGRVVAISAPGNAASIRLLEKLGMRFEKMVRLCDDEPAVMLFA